jgi:hypothetical protein
MLEKPLENLEDDKEYCMSVSCIHRRGCTLYLGNYKTIYKLVDVIDSDLCMTSTPYPFDMLDRFRLSNGDSLS